MAGREQVVDVDGRRVQISSLDKVLYPATGTTKGEVIAYYSAVAKTMLPYCENRPATRKRWPHGVGEDGLGEFFYQKDVGQGAPSWVATGRIHHREHINTYPLVNDAATLVWLAQLAALEIHVPQWQFDRSGIRQNPDRLVFDLDPGEGVSLVECASVAELVRTILTDMGLAAVPVTSGSKGIHLYSALDRSLTSEQASDVARQLARALEADHPDLVTSAMRRDLRPGKVFIDWSQNNAAKTTIAPYSLRGRMRPTVAAPRTWRELASSKLRQLEFHEVLARVEKRGDPLSELLAPSGADERLQVYRSKRSAARTPEPVPPPGETDAEDESDAGPVFVIQRHEARRLHHDFRLEHDGVLVSWALPKGVPTDPKVNHLAVPTEDHPMSYRHFEGTIPRGEYGAGTVQIWDSGHYELEKWRHDEVIVTLYGRPDGGLGEPRRFVLFRTGERDGKAQWMIHLMAPAAAPAPHVPDAPLAPMLAELGDFARLDRLAPEEWAFEMKWDGIRALTVVDGESVRVRSRTGIDLTATYPELHELPQIVNAEHAVLDGEIIALGDNGAPSFARLQERFGLSDPSEVARARRSTPASYLVFDVLSVNGQDCRSLPYRQRRELLEQLFEATGAVPTIAVPPVLTGSAAEALEASESLHLEGIMAKRWSSPYRSGARSLDWLKFPMIQTAEAVVIGWRESAADALGFASLLLAEPDGDGWRYAGRVGTGFSASQRRAIRARLEPLVQDAPAAEVPAEVRRDARWVHPELVCEIVSKGRTGTGLFRHPVWRGWRPDKNPRSLSSTMG